MTMVSFTIKTNPQNTKKYLSNMPLVLTIRTRDKIIRINMFKINKQKIRKNSREVKYYLK